MLLHLSLCCIAAMITSLRDGVNGCSVTPSSAAVIAGNNLSLTCTARDTSEWIDSWRLESDANTARLLYNRPTINPRTFLIEEQEVAYGYLAEDSNSTAPSQVILTIVNASIIQANYYYCLCSSRSSAFAYVSVLASEPTFSNATEITDQKPVNFTCSVSFNGTANTTITIKDSSNNRLNTGNYDGTLKSPHSFSLNYTAIANSSVFQIYFCDIQLTGDPSNTAIFSRSGLNASVHWLSVQNVQINPADASQCMNSQKCAINQTVNCTAAGNPKPVIFQWLTSVNGSGFTMAGTSNQFTFTTAGFYEVQCIAYNDITGTRHNSSSNFTTQVVMERLASYEITITIDNPTEGQQSNNNNTGLIVGIVVGVGGGLLIIAAVISIFLFCKRKKNR